MSLFKTPGAKDLNVGLTVRDENKQISTEVTQVINSVQVPVVAGFILAQSSNAFQINVSESFGQGTLQYAYEIIISENNGSNETFNIPFTNSGTSITGAHDITLASTNTVTITGNIESPLLTFDDPNNYTLTVNITAKDGNGLTSSELQLTASLEATFTTTANIVITTTANTMERSFSASTSSDGGCTPSGLTYAWTIRKISDNSVITTNTNVSFNHTFTESTDYRAELTVTSNCEADNTTSDFNVAVNAPTANFTEAAGSSSVNFDYDAASSISNCVPSTLTYAWTILDPQGGTHQTGSSSTISVTFDEDGEWTIRLQATNACGQSSIFESHKTITIPQVSGTINIANGAGSRERDFSITGASSTPSCTPATYTYNWTVYDTDFTTPLTTGTSSTLNYTFAGDGTYRITCALSNACGDTVLLDESVPVTTAAPTASLTINDDTGTPLQISWDATASSDNGCNPAGITYQVRVYDTDDTTVLHNVTNATGTFTCPYNGSFRVRLDVTSSCGTTFDEETASFTLNPIASQDAPVHAGSGVYTLNDTSIAYDSDSLPDDLKWDVNIGNELIETTGFVARAGSFSGLDHLSGTILGGSFDIADVQQRILYIVLDDLEPLTCARLTTVVPSGITFNSNSYSSVTALRDAVLALYSGNIAYDSTNCLFIWTGSTPPTVSEINIYTDSNYTLGTPSKTGDTSQYTYSITFNEGTSDYHTIDIKEDGTTVLKFHCKTGANLSLGTVVGTAPSSLSGNEINVDTGTFIAAEWGNSTVNDGTSLIFNGHVFRENKSLSEVGFINGNTPEVLTIQHTNTLTTSGSKLSNTITIPHNLKKPTYHTLEWSNHNGSDLLVMSDVGSHNVYLVDPLNGAREVIAGAQPPATTSGTPSVGTSTGNAILFNQPSSVDFDTSISPTTVNGYDIYPVFVWDYTTGNIVELTYNGNSGYNKFNSDSNYSGDGTGFSTRLVVDPTPSRRVNGKPTVWIWIDAFARIKQWNGTAWVTIDQFSFSDPQGPVDLIRYNDSFLVARKNTTADTTHIFWCTYSGTWSTGTAWSKDEVFSASGSTNPVSGIHITGVDGNGNPIILYSRLNETVIYELTANVAAPTGPSDWSSSTWLSDSSLDGISCFRAPGDGYLYAIAANGATDIIKINLTTKAIDISLDGTDVSGNVDSEKE